MVGYVCLSNDTSSYIKKKLKLNSIKLTDFNNNMKIDILINKHFNDKFSDIETNEKLLKKQVKFAKKVIKKLEKNDITSVVIENEIYKKCKVIVNEIYSSDIEVITGDELYENMVTNIIEYILDNNNKIKLSDINLGIAISLITYNRLTFIRNISNTIKGLTILTDDVEKFDNLYKETLSENGLSIKVTNNFKTGLKNCDFIINFDIDNEKLVSTNYNNCIFFNFSNKISKVKKNFKGIIINDIIIKIDDQNIIKNHIDIKRFRNIALMQSLNLDLKRTEILNLVGIKEKIDLSDIERFETYRRKKR